MTMESIFIFTISLILLWIKPGPGQALKITRTLNDGFLAGFFVVTGIITGCLIFFLIAILGANAITSILNNTSMFLKFIGGGYLIYLGYKGFKNIEKGKWKDSTNTASNKKNFIENYTIGFLLTIANPLPIFYFLSIMPTLISIENSSTANIIKGMIIIITVGLSVDLLLLTLVHQTKQALSNTKIIKRFNIITSTGFILIGLYLIQSAFFNNKNYSVDSHDFIGFL